MKPKSAAPFTPEILLAGYPPEIQAVAGKLCRMAKKARPDSAERTHPGWRIVGYSAPRIFCYTGPQRPRSPWLQPGSLAPGPGKLLVQTGESKMARNVLLRPDEKTPVKALVGLAMAAYA